MTAGVRRSGAVPLSLVLNRAGGRLEPQPPFRSPSPSLPACSPVLSLCNPRRVLFSSVSHLPPPASCKKSSMHCHSHPSLSPPCGPWPTHPCHPLPVCICCTFLLAAEQPSYSTGVLTLLSRLGSLSESPWLVV